MERAKCDFNAYRNELNEKIEILQELLANYDDGQRKSFYCLAVNLLELQDINFTMEQIRNNVDSQAVLKEKAKTAANFFQTKADEKGIILKLRK